MSSPIYFICKDIDLPSVGALNDRLADLRYGARIDEPDLWPDRKFGKLTVLRDGKPSTLHLLKEGVRSKGEYVARVLGQPIAATDLSLEIDKIENEFGNQLIETCFSWGDDGVAVAEVHHAVASVSNARLWRPLDRVSSADVLSSDETSRQLTDSLSYQTEQAAVRSAKQSDR
jgi:hypothetical protein